MDESFHKNSGRLIQVRREVSVVAGYGKSNYTQMWTKMEVICPVDLKWDFSNKTGMVWKWNVGLKTRVLIKSLCLKPSNPGTWASIYLTPTPLEGDRRLQLWRVWKSSLPKTSLPFNFYNTLLLNMDYQDSSTRWEMSQREWE